MRETLGKVEEGVKRFEGDKGKEEDDANALTEADGAGEGCADGVAGEVILLLSLVALANGELSGLAVGVGFRVA